LTGPERLLLGDLLSLSSSLLWALAVVCFRLAGRLMGAAEQNLFKNVLGAVLFSLTLPVLGQPFFPAEAGREEWLALCLSGLAGMALADVFFFQSLKLLGATLAAIASALYCPLMILTSWFFLGESAGIGLVLGASLVVSALVVGSLGNGGTRGRDRDLPTGSRLALGILCAVLYILLVVASIVPIKPILDRLDLAGTIWACWVRLTAGAAGMAVLMPFLGRKGAGLLACFRPSRQAAWMLIGALLGSWLTSMAWLLGLKLIPLSRASVLNELYLVFVFILAALILGEPFSGRRALAVAMAFGGTLLVLSGW